jgi:hypothetical protein
MWEALVTRLLWLFGVVVCGMSVACARSETPSSPSPTPTPPPVASCSYSLGSSVLNLAGVGATGSISVTTNSGCAWTVASSASFLTVTSASSNTGPGTVTFSISENLGEARTATLTIAGQAVNVTQAASDPVFGNWAGTIVKGSGCAATLPASAQWTGTIRRNAAGIHEFLISIPSALVFNQAVSLLVNGNTMTFAVPVDTLYTFNATLAADRRSFTGTFSGGTCSGTWSGTRQ